ncbi:SAM-dependent methyltransferase [Corynebacterium phocae]|uniref:SAM-dependent methyltransferase n=1 Tax=Corynebacterium phocae TaxID=161895 RepID=A0A1L7D5W4_9CORY|nr:class I SAM-dependent methyltransferase [Corynebacterium phocae]APT93383.1 SAM-dependent methyltransferase [Corynebacterium phocae]KAA8721725.1 class I SAM-dependent methyltransferase [Corynebacterium phocae]
MPSKLPQTAALATLARSWRLLRSFRFEQTRPDIFYGGLAADTAALVGALAADHGLGLHGARVLDVGGGPGYFAAAFAARGADYFGVEPDASEMTAAGITLAGAVRGDGTALPFATGTFDITYSSNVVEHVARPWDMAQEMLRVTRPGGLVIISYTVWLGPFGGHETGLWQHYLGGEFARDRYARKHGRAPKNVFGQSLFAVSAREGLEWAARHRARTFPRYHPSWAWWVTRVPLLREFFTSNLVIVTKKHRQG